MPGGRSRLKRPHRKNNFKLPPLGDLKKDKHGFLDIKQMFGDSMLESDVVPPSSDEDVASPPKRISMSAEGISMSQSDVVMDDVDFSPAPADTSHIVATPLSVDSVAALTLLATEDVVEDSAPEHLDPDSELPRRRLSFSAATTPHALSPPADVRTQGASTHADSSSGDEFRISKRRTSTPATTRVRGNDSTLVGASGADADSLLDITGVSARSSPGSPATPVSAQSRRSAPRGRPSPRSDESSDNADSLLDVTGISSKPSPAATRSSARQSGTKSRSRNASKASLRQRSASSSPEPGSAGSRDTSPLVQSVAVEDTLPLVLNARHSRRSGGVAATARGQSRSSIRSPPSLASSTDEQCSDHRRDSCNEEEDRVSSDAGVTVNTAKKGHLARSPATSKYSSQKKTVAKSRHQDAKPRHDKSRAPASPPVAVADRRTARGSPQSGSHGRTQKSSKSHRRAHLSSDEEGAFSPGGGHEDEISTDEDARKKEKLKSKSGHRQRGTSPEPRTGARKKVVSSSKAEKSRRRSSTADRHDDDDDDDDYDEFAHGGPEADDVCSNDEDQEDDNGRHLVSAAKKAAKKRRSLASSPSFVRHFVNVKSERRAEAKKGKKAQASKSGSKKKNRRPDSDESEDGVVVVGGVLPINKNLAEFTLPNETAGPGIRRSQRTRVRPLAYWTNETLAYEGDAKGMSIVGVTKPLMPVSNPTMTPAMIKSMQRTKKQQEKKNRGTDFNFSSVSLPMMDDLPVQVVVNRRGDFGEMSVFASAPSIRSTLDSTPFTSGVRVAKSLHVNNIESGVIEVKPGAQKPYGHVKGSTLIFHVVAGDMSFTIAGTEQRLKRGSVVAVPPYNSYAFANLSNKVAYLALTQVSPAV